MKFTRCLAALMVTLSLAGCCCGSNVVMDSCDPCGASMPRQRCGLSWLWPGSWFHGCGHGCGCGCSSGCGSGCGMYGEIFDGGCCGGGGGYDCGGYGPGVVMNGMPSSGGCACGQTAPPMISAPSSSVPMINSAPANSTPTYSAPTQAPEPPPVPPSNDQTTMIPPSPSSNQMQTVSYEEFQRLPGTIISGPGAIPSAAPASTPSVIQQTSAASVPFLPPPSVSAPSASRPLNPSQNRQALWQAAKTY